jgi:hypothetical protein
MAVMGLLIGAPDLASATAEEAASRRLSIAVVAEGGRDPFEAAVIAVAIRHESGAWSSAGRVRTDAAGRSSLEIHGAATAVHVLVVCSRGDRVLSGDAALQLEGAGSPLSIEVSIESGSDGAVRCSPTVEEATPRWPWPVPFPRQPRWPSPYCDPFPCPDRKAEAS